MIAPKALALSKAKTYVHAAYWGHGTNHVLCSPLPWLGAHVHLLY